MRNRLRLSTLETLPVPGTSHGRDAIFHSPPETDFFTDHRTCTSHHLLPLAPPTPHDTFAELLATQAASLTDAPTEHLSGAITFALKGLVECLSVERACLAEVTPSGALAVASEYYLPEFPPFPPILLEARHGWQREQLRQGKALVLTHLPGEKGILPNLANEADIHPSDIIHLLFPLRVGGDLLGALVLSSSRLGDATLQELTPYARQVNEVFGHALARMLMETKLQHLRDQLAHVSRVTMLGELAGAIAHEVNQPLCAVVSNAQTAQRLLAGDAPDLEEVGEALHDIAADGRRASEILARIRILLKKGPAAHGPVDLNLTIRDTAALLQASLVRHRIRLNLRLAERLMPVPGDRVQLQQVILNLMLNAIDAVTHRDSGQRQLELQSFLNDQGAVEVVVRDSGPGLAPELYERVFDAFFSTKAEGMGIGLSICRTILEASGGRIWAAPDPDGGTAFHFTLPVFRGSQP